MRQRINSARAPVIEKQTRMQREISEYEHEAQELERLEADLLGKLQET